jgi:hypothetical protein
LVPDGNDLRLYDLATDALLLDHSEQYEELESSQRKTEYERERAEQARYRADQEHKRAEQERHQAQQERERADKLAAEVARLREMLEQRHAPEKPSEEDSAP